MKKAALIALTLAALVGTSGATFAHEGHGNEGEFRGILGKKIIGLLNGTAEIPGPGDPDGVGFGWARTKPNKGEVCYELIVQGIAPDAGAHSLRARGSGRPVVVNLTPPTTGSSKGCVTGLDKVLVKNIKDNPELYYFNVHNADYPAGAIRGQLSRVAYGDAHDVAEADE